MIRSAFSVVVLLASSVAFADVVVDLRPGSTVTLEPQERTLVRCMYDENYKLLPVCEVVLDEGYYRVKIGNDLHPTLFILTPHDLQAAVNLRDSLRAVPLCK